MRLAISSPEQRVLIDGVSKVSAEGVHGCFTILPRHIDIVAGLVPGILSYLDGDDCERYVAVDEGLLVKQGPFVRVSSRTVVASTDLGTLEATVRERFLDLDERELVARAALARLEADFIRRITEL